MKGRVAGNVGLQIFPVFTVIRVNLVPDNVIVVIE